MSIVAPKTRKHLSADALFRVVRSGFATIPDPRCEEVDLSLTDTLMSAFAMFSLKAPSLLAFDKERAEGNLHTIYGLQHVPCDTYMRERLDPVSPKWLRPVFKSVFRQLQRGKALEEMVFLNGHYLLALDGTEYFSSKTIHCASCLHRVHRNGSITYAHQMSGNVLLSIRPRPGLPSGTEIRNKASIQFEIFETIDTNEVVNIIDTTRPNCVMNPLPRETSTESFSVSWSGTDAVGEIESYSVLVSVDGGNFTPFLERTGETSATFVGEVGKTYGFLCVATDTAGNIEVQETEAETVTQVVSMPANQPPMAQCQNVTLPTAPGVCSATSSVNNGSFDPDGDPITLQQSPSGPYSLGTTDVTLTVIDKGGLSDACTARVTVQDRTAPVVSSVSANPSNLWPPNHEMVPVRVSASVSDICDTAPVCKIISVSSNEPIDGLGDGDTSPDWEITGNLMVNLRAERSGTGKGRVYTIAIQCTDVSGNSSTKTVTVTVPHN